MATDAQKKARNKWNAKNKDRATLYRYRSQAKKFIKEMATLEDVKALRRLLDDREKELKE